MNTITTGQGTFTLKNGDHFTPNLDNDAAVFVNRKGTIFWDIKAPKGTLIKYASGVRKFVCK